MAKEIMEGLVKTDKGIVKIVGHDGATFTPHVSEDFVLSWTNNKGLPNPPDLKLPSGESAVAEHNESQTAHGDIRKDIKKAQDEIEKLKANGVPGGGLNEEAANLLIYVLKHATYKEDVSSQIERLEEILLGNSGGEIDSGLTITDDGNGNVVITTFGNATIIDDENGNVTITVPDGVSIADDGNGNVIIV